MRGGVLTPIYITPLAMPLMRQMTLVTRMKLPSYTAGLAIEV